MFGSRTLQLLIVALSVLLHAQAMLDDKLAHVRKQVDDLLPPILGDSSSSADPAGLTSSSGSSIATSSTSDAPVTSSSSVAPLTSSIPTTAAAEPTTTAPLQPTSEPTQFTTPPPSSVPTSSSSSSSSFSETDQSSSSSSADESSSSKTRSLVVTTEFTVVTRTNSDGSKHTMTSAEEVTSTPGLNTGDGDDDNSSMSSKTRNTIIGVVVGVGGAVALGALALLAYRIWGRKKHTEESEAFMPYGNTGYEGIGGKSEHDASNSIGQQSSPFQSTLEGYHSPNNGTVNHSHNF